MKLIVSSSTLLKNLQKVSGVISSNTVLPILEDFLFDIKSSVLTVSATDLETSISTSFEVQSAEDFKIAIPAKILVNILKELPEQPVTITNRTLYTIRNTNFIIPKKALNQLKSIVPNNDTEVSMSYNKDNVFFHVANVYLVCRLIDQRFPDYNNVIPKENPNLLVISREDLLGTLKRTTIFSNKTTNQVVLKIVGNTLAISAQDLDFSNEASEQLSCEYTGEDLEIGFNSKFLIEMLNTITDQEIRIELSTPTRAGILKPQEQDEQEDLLMLVMPVMITK